MRCLSALLFALQKTADKGVLSRQQRLTADAAIKEGWMELRRLVTRAKMLKDSLSDPGELAVGPPLW